MTKTNLFNINFRFLTLLLILLSVGARPISELCSSFLDDDMEVIELVGEEDAEEEIDDLEEDKLIQEEYYNTSIHNLTSESFSIQALDPASLYYPGVISPPPEYTLS